jgi:hypothetical protein
MTRTMKPVLDLSVIIKLHIKFERFMDSKLIPGGRLEEARK